MDVTPLRLDEVEQNAIGKQPDGAWIDETSTIAANSGSPESDMHASAEYRRELAQHLTTKALNEALQRCGRGA